ncbi:UrcA family protein [Sphingomonas sp. XXL09]|uniref:UrcA family protein n=1 Tax=Sphingomonas sp. XXL09 TaxID=3457787 RepID=UPI00406BB70C
MKSLIRVASASLLLSCLSIGTVAADPERETVSARVSTKGLNLNNPKHRAILDARVMRAAAWACAPYGADVAAQRDAEHCRAEMRESGHTAVATLVGHQAVRLASLSSSAEVVSAR